MFCLKCGNETNDGTKFCPKCGNQLNNNQGNVQQTNSRKKSNIINKQTIGLVVGIALIGFGFLLTAVGLLEGLVLAGVGAIIMFYTKGK